MWFTKLLLLIVFCGSIQNWVTEKQKEATQVHLIKIVDDSSYDDEGKEVLARNLFNPSSIHFPRGSLRASNP